MYQEYEVLTLGAELKKLLERKIRTADAKIRSAQDRAGYPGISGERALWGCRQRHHGTETHFKSACVENPLIT